MAEVITLAESTVDTVPPNRADAHTVVALHRLLLWADSRLPDRVVVAAQAWLADGLVADVAQVVAFAAITSGLAVRADHATLLTDVLRRSGSDASDLAALKVTDGDPLPECAVAAVDNLVLAEYGPAVPICLDLTGGADRPGGRDDVDVAAAAVLAQLPGAYGLWRSWRFQEQADRIEPAPPATRCYLIMMTSGVRGERLPAVTAEFQRRVAEANVLVRAFQDEAALPSHHRIALRFAALVWTSAPTPLIRHVQTDGTASDTLAEPERVRLLQYLRQGSPVWLGAPLPSGTRPPASNPKATSFWTDGSWLWSDILRDGVERGSVKPDKLFLAHASANGYQCPPVDTVALHRAVAALIDVS